MLPFAAQFRALRRRRHSILDGVVTRSWPSPSTAVPNVRRAAQQDFTWEAGVEKEEEQGKRFALIAREQGVHHFVYSSVGSANRGTGIPHFENKWRVEETVRGLNFPSVLMPAGILLGYAVAFFGLAIWRFRFE